MAKEVGHLVPWPIVIIVQINDRPVRALIDSGSLGDLMSTQLSDQLKVMKQYHQTPIPLHLAIQGSRSKIHCGTTVNLTYQSIHADYYFDIANISNYDLILSTPWLFQYQVRIGLNPTTIEVRSNVPTPIQGDNVAEVHAQSMSINGDDLEGARNVLLQYTKPICKTVAETPLLPLRRINHTIPLIDENKIYSWRPFWCPEAY
ncbi:hypothetical protein F5876DRAFT_52648 [Lentinula aff. lateritia]|uniref:Uncharacterized protein n=1 Tax=Lentinula aff. lateritia TaxID=2804960 RepID=A0ACC1TJP4_9AGAR|nr:hypothetical protein F5876DRAFT_52648 [Lentinula aff. lateritia]